MSFTPSYEFLKRVNELKTEGFPVEINQNTGSATLCEGEYCNKTLKITMYENPYELYLWAFYPDYQLTRSSFARRIYEDTLSKSYKEAVNMWGCDGQVLFSDRTPVFALKIDNPSKNIMIYLHVIYTIFKAMDQLLMKFGTYIPKAEYPSSYSSCYSSYSNSRDDRNYRDYRDYDEYPEDNSYESYRASAGWCGDEDDCPEE